MKVKIIISLIIMVLGTLIGILLANGFFSI